MHWDTFNAVHECLFFFFLFFSEERKGGERLIFGNDFVFSGIFFPTTFLGFCVVLTMDMRPFDIEIDKKKKTENKTENKKKEEKTKCREKVKKKIEIKKYNFCEYNRKYCISHARHPPLCRLLDMMCGFRILKM